MQARAAQHIVDMAVSTDYQTRENSIDWLKDQGFPASEAEFMLESGWVQSSDGVEILHHLESFLRTEEEPTPVEHRHSIMAAPAGLLIILAILNLIVLHDLTGSLILVAIVTVLEIVQFLLAKR